MLPVREKVDKKILWNVNKEIKKKMKLFLHIKRWIKKQIPDKIYLSYIYWRHLGSGINWNHPQTFTEKLQWLKVYDFKPEYTKLVDKLAVKDIVGNIIGFDYIIPTIGVWDRAEDIEWDKLPNQFVLKTTHGGGSFGVVICKDKSKFDFIEAKKKLSVAMLDDIGYEYRERPYINVPHRIIAEKYLPSLVGIEQEVTEIKDYKFFCFSGKVKFFKIDFGRFTEHHANYYDTNGCLLPFGEKGLEPDPQHIEDIPEKLGEMIEIAERLSNNKRFLRVDLYYLEGRIFFGEITFYPAAGLGLLTPDEWNIKVGDMINTTIL